MACNCCNNRRRSTPGYTLVENSTAQTWAATGASALTITGVTSPGYNVSIVIERFN